MTDAKDAFERDQYKSLEQDFSADIKFRDECLLAAEKALSSPTGEGSKFEVSAFQDGGWWGRAYGKREVLRELIDGLNNSAKQSHGFGYITLKDSYLHLIDICEQKLSEMSG